jgi:hypothetical protein
MQKVGAMTDFRNAAAKGDWLNLERLRGYSLILLAVGVIAIAALFVTAKGINDYKGRPLGTDFSNVYAAGKYVLEGKPAAPFSPALQFEKEKSIFGADTLFYGWHYPPVFLALAGLFALLPYLLSLIVWQAASLALYLWNVLAITQDRRALLPALAYPAVFINLSHGQNGFLTAALFGGGLLLLDSSPVTAGILIGLLVYKPQFGLVIPLALAVSRRWRAFFAAALTALAICAATYFLYGPETWLAFRESLAFTRTAVLEDGGTGFFKIQSAFATARLWGAPVTLAYAAQAVVTLAAAVCLVWLWRGKASLETKSAGLIAAALLSTPYALDYDLVLMGPALAFFAAAGIKRGFLPYEKTLLAFCWFAPLLARPVAEHTGLPLGLIALIVLFALAIRRAAAEGAALHRAPA